MVKMRSQIVLIRAGSVKRVYGLPSPLQLAWVIPGGVAESVCSKRGVGKTFFVSVFLLRFFLWWNLVKLESS
jgi:hypothetical protein